MVGRYTGKIAFARTRAGVVGGVFLDWDGAKGRVLLADGRREVWTEDRLVWTSETRVPLHSEGVARKALLDFCDRVREVQVDLSSLWDLTVGEGSEWSIADLADLAYPRAGAEHRAALACALALDDVFFRPGAVFGVVTPHSREAVEQVLIRRQREAQEESRLARAVSAIEEALGGKGDDAPTGKDGRDFEMGVEWLKALVLEGEDERAGARGARLVRAVMGAEVRDLVPAAFEILVKVGVFHEDEVLGLHRHQIALDFPPEVEAEAARILASFPEICRGLDRPEIKPTQAYPGPFAVDDPWTTEVDDALWVEELDEAKCLGSPSKTRVHVLIADPSCGIPLHSPVAMEGMARAATVYLPDRKIPMFPRILSEQAFSLRCGTPRPMMDFRGDFDAHGNLLDFCISPVFATLERRLTYDEVDAILADPGNHGPIGRVLETLSFLATTLRRRREEAGAIVVIRDDVSVRVIDGEIRVRRLRGDSPARRLVTEFMVFACTQAGSFARREGVPVVYRRQSPPDHPPPSDVAPGTRAWAYRMLRSLKRADLSVHPEHHFGLGVTGYTQVTSPLRRFQDFVVHAQIRGFLQEGRAPLDAKKILAMFGDLENRTEARTQVEKEARRYFLLKYLKSFEGGEVAGEVVATHGNKAVVELVETGLEVSVNGAGHLPLGKEVLLRVLEVHPRGDRIAVRLA